MTPPITDTIGSEELELAAKRTPPTLGSLNGLHMAQGHEDEEREAHGEVAKAKGVTIVGFARRCRRCAEKAAYHSPRANWMNRVICLKCGKTWSE